MSAAANIVGGVVMAIAAAAILFALLAYAFDTVHRWHERQVNRAVEAELRRHGVDMHRLASWFNNVDQAATWMAVADNMSRGIWPDVRSVRDAGIPHERAQLLQLRQPPRKELTR